MGVDEECLCDGRGCSGSRDEFSCDGHACAMSMHAPGACDGHACAGRMRARSMCVQDGLASTTCVRRARVRGARVREESRGA